MQFSGIDVSFFKNYNTYCSYWFYCVSEMLAIKHKTVVYFSPT